MNRPVRIGCSGWQYDSWRGGAFYPERCPQRRWLSYYARQFETVEVNSTFYRLAQAGGGRALGRADAGRTSC